MIRLAAVILDLYLIQNLTFRKERPNFNPFVVYTCLENLKTTSIRLQRIARTSGDDNDDHIQTFFFRKNVL